jgi:hypothetical protein
VAAAEFSALFRVEPLQADPATIEANNPTASNTQDSLST